MKKEKKKERERKKEGQKKKLQLYIYIYLEKVSNHKSENSQNVISTNSHFTNPFIEACIPLDRSRCIEATI